MPINDPPSIWPRQPAAPAQFAPTQQGWECPVCHGTYAPWMATCTECKPPANSLRTRITEAQPPLPRQSGPLPPMGTAGTSVTTATMGIDQARLTMCSGAQPSWTSTVWLGGKTYGPETGRDGDDGAAGVPARI